MKFRDNVTNRGVNHRKKRKELEERLQNEGIEKLELEVIYQVHKCRGGMIKPSR